MAADDTSPLNPQPLTFDPDNPGRNIVRHCRSLTVGGAPCRQAALRGHDYCTTHANREPRAFEEPGHIAIPLLEDASAIQLICTKIVHGVANRRTSPTEANSMLRACAVAASTLPRPVRLKPSAEPERVQPPFSSITLDECNNLIAPREPWLDASGMLTQYESFAPRLTNRQIDPVTAVTDRYRQLIFELVQQRANRDTAESAAALAAGLPEPHPGKWHAFKTGHCAFLTAFCHGPLDPEPCDFCLGVQQMPSDHSYYPGDDAVAIVTALRNHLQQQTAKPKPHQTQQQKENEPQQQPEAQQQPAVVAENSSPAPQQDQNASQVPHISAVGDVARVPHPGRVPHLHARRVVLTRRKARRTSTRHSVNLNAAADFSDPGEPTRSACAPGSPHQRKHQAQRDTVEEQASRPALAPEKITASAPANANVDSRLPDVAGARDIRTRRTSSTRFLANRTLAKRRPTNHIPTQAHVVKLVNPATANIPKDQELVPAQKNKVSAEPAIARNPKRPFRNTVENCATLRCSLPLLSLDRQRARYFASERQRAFSESDLANRNFANRFLANRFLAAGP